MAWSLFPDSFQLTNDRAEKAGSIEEQTEQVLNTSQPFSEGGQTAISVLSQVTIYVSDMDFWSPVNTVYAKFMGEEPAGAVPLIPTGLLHYGFLTEIDAVAAVND